MHNRWFHRPTLHSPSHGNERKVGWLELFYDLIYVATFIQLGNALSHHTDVQGFLAFAGLLVPLWFTWTGFTFYSNRFVVDDFAHRATVFAQMFGIGAMAVFVQDVFEGDPAPFALAYASVRVVHVVFYLRAYLQLDKARDMNRRYIIGFTAGLVLWASSSLLPAPWVYLVWAAAMGIDLSTVLSRHARDLTGRYPPDILHMSERYGLLTIIVLGESFVKVLSAVSDELAAHGGTDILLMAGLALFIVCSLWWIYFDDVAGSRIKRGPLKPFVWVYAHLPLTIALTGSGVAIKKATFFEPEVAAGDGYRWLLCGTLALVLLSVGIIDAVTERRQSDLSDRARINMRIASAFVILLLAPTGRFMPAWAFLGLVSLAAVVQVLFDLSMAPLAADPHAAHEEDPNFSRLMKSEDEDEDDDRDPQDAAVGRLDKSKGLVSADSRRSNYQNAVRKGTPNELKRDLYVHLMDGSWTRIFVSLGLVFLFINVIFAALYMLEPGSISAAGEGSFFDMFAFSVQTMSSIGYGTMSPNSDYAHVLVTIEAMLSILGIAMATGLLFAKASQPRASVLFSKVAVVNTRDGKRTLSFRAGNARGNEVVEASVRVVVLQDEITPEGHTMRRLVDLPLVRSASPLFVMSWTVMHVIDENSPLHGLSDAAMGDQVLAFIVTMTGHDSTFAQTTHARTIYYPEDLRFGHRFVDVISHLDDGRMLLDFERFHDTVPELASPPAAPGASTGADSKPDVESDDSPSGVDGTP